MKLLTLLLLSCLSFAASAQWTTNGSNIYFNTGNVGLGTGSPGAKLSFTDVNTHSNAEGITWYSPSPTGYGIYRGAGAWNAPDYQQLNLTWATGIVLNPGASYGKSFVDVQGGGLRVSDGQVVLQRPSSGYVTFWVKNSDGSNRLSLDYNSTIHAGGIFYLRSGGDLAINDVDGANVGIGTASPSNIQSYGRVLDVRGLSHSKIIATTGASPTHISGLYSHPSYGGAVGTETNHDFHLMANYDFKMTVTPAGNVGVGTTTPGQKLDVRGNLILENGGHPVLYTGTGTAELGRFLQLINSTGLASASGLKAGGILVSDSYSYASPSKNDLIVKGNVGIGTASPDAKLSVKGQVHAQEVKVDLNGAVAPDYVFNKDYRLPSLEEIKSYIEKNNHLPGVPSAKEMETNGMNLGEMNLTLLKKVEELTLYVIELKKESEAMRAEFSEKIESLSSGLTKKH